MYSYEQIAVPMYPILHLPPKLPINWLDKRMAALRDLVLAVERDQQPLDTAMLSFSQSLLLSPSFDTVSIPSELGINNASSLRLQFLAVHPQGELLLRVWPEQHGGSSRWEKRESFATFLHVVTHLLQAQDQLNSVQAEAFALRVVREKTSHLEKMLSWSDKPLVEFRALELLTTVVKVSAVAAREFVRLFNFQCPAFVKLATRRWKKLEPVNGKVKHASFQLRAAYVDLVLALTACPDKSVHRFAMKEGGVTASLFKSMDGDSAELLTTIFTRLGDLVLYSQEVDHKNKLVVFNGTCVHQLLALLQVKDEEKVRETALQMLKALFFKDSALYVVPQKQALRLFLAKSASSQSNEDAVSSEEAYALKVIRNAVATIGVKELLHSTQAETLVMQFLTKYPGFVSEYLAALSVQLEPRLVYRWFCVTSLVQKLLSCSLDAAIMGMPAEIEDTLTSWCSAQTIASKLIAPGNFRKELSRSIQHSNKLVIYSSLGVIEAMLNRYVRLVPSLKSLGLALDVQSELRYLFPSPEALVSLLLKLCASQERSIALVYVRALTVFRLYLECLPQAMREVKVDFTKTLTWRYLDCPVDGSAESAMPAPTQLLIVGEMLRFLLAVDTSRLRFLFTSGSSGQRSKLRQMLLLYVSTPCRAVQELAGQVLQRTLLTSDIFGLETHGEQHSPGGRASKEVTFWLESLCQGGGKICAEFTEQLVRAVLVDPLMFVSIGSRVVTNASSSLSPITVALVGFLDTRTDVDMKLDLSTYHADPCVIAFAVRILLAVMQTSEHPQQLVALIASNCDFPDRDVSATRLRVDVKDETSSADSNNKKRKRSIGSDDCRCEDDAYAWLKTTCKSFVSGKCIGKSAPKKMVRAASSSTWDRLNDPNALTAALVAITPSSFCSCWEQIVSNCADIAQSFDPILHYLSGRGDVDILSLLTLSETSSATKKKNWTAQAADHVLFSIASRNCEEQESAIVVVISMVKSRVKDHQLVVTDAVRMCDQLVFFFSSNNLGFSDTGHAHLCELLLNLLTIVIVSSEKCRASSVVTRLFYKLRAAITSTLSSGLRRQLSAVEIVALHVCSSMKPDTDLTKLCDFGNLVQRTGVPLVAVLASRVPSRALVAVLDNLLHQSSVVTVASPNIVLVERVLEFLGHNDVIEQYASFADYKRTKLLTQKLWQLLSSQSGKWCLLLLTNGFRIVGNLGGVDASTAVASVETFLLPLVVRSAHVISNDKQCTETLRAIVTAIRSGIEAAVFPVVFEEQLLNWLQREKDERVKCVLVGAIYDVFARVRNHALHHVSKELIPICLHRMLLDLQESYAAELAMMRHLLIDSSLSVYANRLDASVQAFVEKFESCVHDETLSSGQLLALLLLSRNSGFHESMDASLLVILMKSGMCALKAAQNNMDKHFLSERTKWLHKSEATILLVESTVECFKHQGQEKQTSVLKMLLPLVAVMREGARVSTDEVTFKEFVLLTAALLRLVGHDVYAIDYDFVAHFVAVVQHPCFVRSLQNADNVGLQLLLARVVARLARITGNYTRSLLQTLLSSYSMSLSPFDRSLRVLFEEFEAREEDGLTLVSMGFRFGASSTIPPSAAMLASSKSSHNDLVDDSAWVLGGGLEQDRVRATIDRFPLWREVSTLCDAYLLDLDEELHIDDSSIKAEHFPLIDGKEPVEGYDPAFILPMLSHFISSSDFHDGAIVQQGLLGVAIRATSSDVKIIREHAFGILAHVHESLQATTETTSGFKAGRQVHLLLDVFRRGVEKSLQQVPSVVTVFLNDALAVLTRPTHVLYPQVNHFLLARPAMDLADVPMFYSLFNSRAPLTFRQERSWLLHALRRGICNDDDVVLLVRRHVLPMLLSFFTSELADTHTQPLIVKILLAALRTPSGGVYLVTKAGLVEWLAVQFLKHGAASLSTKSHNVKLLGSIRTASSAILLPLMNVLEQALHDRIWGILDATQQHAAALQAVNAFASLHAALAACRAESKNDHPLTSKVAVIAEWVVRRAGSVCSLKLLHKAIEVVQQSAMFENVSINLAEMVASNLAQWLLQRRHYQAQKQYFHDWAVLLRQVASLLVSYDNHTGLAKQQRMRHALEQMKSSLDQLPTLKLLVISSTANNPNAAAHALL
ncbi:unnamed protein product [Peronospora belbahrii]|uniref:Nucleolar pre-ribosomal-associated protein 1 C-terminal domain-containing protein n=1 Tax=Peronospora belbahrii TaxID=622444 RepID=A0AAU9KTR0_9STRA|nr:unnamed protein product [Peronospora belbahrii]